MRRGGVGEAGPATVGPATVGPARRGGARGRQGFSLGVEPSARPGGAAPVASPQPAESLLAVQLVAAAPAAAAEEHVNVMLADLALLQRALLSGDEPGCRVNLRDLATRRAALPARDIEPALAEILDAVALRAEIELVRHGGARAGTGTPG